MKKIPKVIALDVGRVSVSLHYGEIIRSLNLPPSEFWPPEFLHYCTLLETDRISEEEWMEKFIAATDGKYTGRELMDAFSRIIGNAMPGMDEIVRSLAEKYRLVFFSNISRLHQLEVMRKCSFAHLISGSIYSFEAGCMKPECGIYEAFEKRFGIPFAYFDDRPENIEAALARGWSGARLFTSSRQMRIDLSAMEQV